MRTDNETLRALFALPPIKKSACTSIAVPAMPALVATTGDREVDAVLWLQNIVQSGHQAYIDKALEAVKRIETPMKELENRYAEYLRGSGAHVFQIIFGTMGFGDLESKSKAAIKKATNRHDALARFGSIDALFADTPAEKACKKALRGLKFDSMNFYDGERARERFEKHLALVPATIDDCLYVMAYDQSLYDLRNATGDCGDALSQAYAHKCYCLSMMAHITPRDRREALTAFDYLQCEEKDSSEAPDILRNLIVTGWGADFAPPDPSDRTFMKERDNL
jgi:hypothetical protein